MTIMKNLKVIIEIEIQVTEKEAKENKAKLSQNFFYVAKRRFEHDYAKVICVTVNDPCQSKKKTFTLVPLAHIELKPLTAYFGITVTKTKDDMIAIGDAVKAYCIEKEIEPEDVDFNCILDLVHEVDKHEEGTRLVVQEVQ